MGYFLSGQTLYMEGQRWKYENLNHFFDLSRKMSPDNYAGTEDQIREMMRPLLELSTQLKPVPFCRYFLHYLIRRCAGSSDVQKDAGSPLATEQQITAYAEQLYMRECLLPKSLEEEILRQIRSEQPLTSAKEKRILRDLAHLSVLDTLKGKDVDLCWKFLLLLNVGQQEAEELQTKVLMKPGFQLTHQKDFCLYLTFFCEMHRNGKMISRYRQYCRIKRMYEERKKLCVNNRELVLPVRGCNTDTIYAMIDSFFPETDGTHLLSDELLTEIIDMQIRISEAIRISEHSGGQDGCHSRRVKQAGILLEDLISQTQQHHENVVNLLDQIYYSEDTAGFEPYCEQLQPIFDILESTRLNNARLSAIRNGKSYYNSGVRSKSMQYTTPKHINVRRQDILTMGWLRMIFEWEKYGDAQEYYGIYGRIADFVDYIDPILTRCGYYPFYMGQSYDHLLIFLLCYEKPLKIFQLLWSLKEQW